MDWTSRSDKPLVIGHRGASHDAPENTLAAFGLALEQGAVGVELDVQLSADGWPVVIHDFKVDRTTDGTGVVSQMKLAELQALSAGEGQTISTLDEVFEAFGPRLLYNIEIKEFRWRDSGLEAAVADQVQAHNLESKVLMSSFSPFAVRRCRRYFPRTIPVALIREDTWQQYLYLLADGEADHPHYSMVDEKYMAWASRRGYQVNVWTVDAPEEAHRLARLGVHSLITNQPALIRESLESLP